jgi:hypothetical protein
MFVGFLFKLQHYDNSNVNTSDTFLILDSLIEPNHNVI